MNIFRKMRGSKNVSEEKKQTEPAVQDEQNEQSTSAREATQEPKDLTAYKKALRTYLLENLRTGRVGSEDVTKAMEEFGLEPLKKSRYREVSLFLEYDKSMNRDEVKAALAKALEGSPLRIAGPARPGTFAFSVYHEDVRWKDLETGTESRGGN